MTVRLVASQIYRLDQHFQAGLLILIESILNEGRHLRDFCLCGFLGFCILIDTKSSYQVLLVPCSEVK